MATVCCSSRVTNTRHVPAPAAFSLKDLDIQAAVADVSEPETLAPVAEHANPLMVPIRDGIRNRCQVKVR